MNPYAWQKTYCTVVLRANDETYVVCTDYYSRFGITMGMSGTDVVQHLVDQKWRTLHIDTYFEFEADTITTSLLCITFVMTEYKNGI